MSEVQVKDGDGGGKNKQKKQTLRVDFTPMVDMNMLLITFFMFCTTLLKPQTMNINMPSKDKVEDEQRQEVRESTAVTLILAGNDELYYYLGMPADDGSSYLDPDFLVASDYTVEGLRSLLKERNKGTFEDIEELKIQKQHKEITDEEYNEKAKAIQDDALKVRKTAPSVLIKPTDLATYKNTVDALDEMLVCNIGSFTIMDMTDGDRHLLYKKTGNPEYLTEQQVQELNGK